MMPPRGPLPPIMGTSDPRGQFAQPGPGIAGHGPVDQPVPGPSHGGPGGPFNGFGPRGPVHVGGPMGIMPGPMHPGQMNPMTAGGPRQQAMLGAFRGYDQ